MKYLTAWFITTAALFAAEPARPLDTPAAWTFADPTAWTWSKDDGRAVLTLHRQQAFKPAVRSPFNLAWLKTGEWKSFTLTVETQLTKFEAGNNELCLPFPRQDATRF